MKYDRVMPHEIDLVKREMIENMLMVTPESVAKILSVNVRTVERIVSEGMLSCYDRCYERNKRVTRSSRFKMVELREFVNSIKVTTNYL